MAWPQFKQREANQNYSDWSSGKRCVEEESSLVGVEGFMLTSPLHLFLFPFPSNRVMLMLMHNVRPHSISIPSLNSAQQKHNTQQTLKVTITENATPIKNSSPPSPLRSSIRKRRLGRLSIRSSSRFRSHFVFFFQCCCGRGRGTGCRCWTGCGCRWGIGGWVGGECG